MFDWLSSLAGDLPAVISIVAIGLLVFAISGCTFPQEPNVNSGLAFVGEIPVSGSLRYER